jgi:cobalt/nickel transport protein
MTTKRILLILLAGAVILAPILVSGDFAGTDDQAAEAVGQLSPGYRPWAKAVWEPSEAAEPYIFALQAALGVAFIAYFFHRLRRRAG